MSWYSMAFLSAFILTPGFLTPTFLKEKVLLIHTPELIASVKAERQKAGAALKPPPTLFQKIVNALTP